MCSFLPLFFFPFFNKLTNPGSTLGPHAPSLNDIWRVLFGIFFFPCWLVPVSLPMVQCIHITSDLPTWLLPFHSAIPRFWCPLRSLAQNFWTTTQSLVTKNNCLLETLNPVLSSHISCGIWISSIIFTVKIFPFLPWLGWCLSGDKDQPYYWNHLPCVYSGEFLDSR